MEPQIDGENSEPMGQAAMWVKHLLCAWCALRSVHKLRLGEGRCWPCLVMWSQWTSGYQGTGGYRL
jgi:hypothetical protein